MEPVIYETQRLDHEKLERVLANNFVVRPISDDYRVRSPVQIEMGGDTMAQTIGRWAVIATLCILRTVGVAWGQGSTPPPPPDERLGLYVIDIDPDLDTGCVFRDRSPLTIPIVVPRVVAESQVDPAGLLIDADGLVDRGVLRSTFAKISFPVFDIDSEAETSPDFEPEVDQVSFNGERIKTLRGENNLWTDDQFEVDISKIRFGEENELRIDIDTANDGGCFCWCMQVAWVSIEFDVAAPYVLVHGINAQSDSWDLGDPNDSVIAAIEKFGAYHFRANLGRNASSVANGIALESQIRTNLDLLKSEKVHVIAHSKGGIDSEMMIARAPKFDVLSISTFSTPFLGSSAADLAVIRRMEAARFVNDGDDPDGHIADYVGSAAFAGSLGLGPDLPGLLDLTTEVARNSQLLRSSLPPTLTLGANADLDGDLRIDGTEAAGSGLPQNFALTSADTVWNVLRSVASARVVRTELRTIRLPGLPPTFVTVSTLVYETTQAPNLPNDLVVTTLSANPSYSRERDSSLRANHTTIRSGPGVTRMLEKTIDLE